VAQSLNASTVAPVPAVHARSFPLQPTACFRTRPFTLNCCSWQRYSLLPGCVIHLHGEHHSSEPKVRLARDICALTY
jgi:hypothetical protein